MKQANIDSVHLEAGAIGATMVWYPLQMLFHSSSDRLALAGVPIQVPDQQKIKREEYLAYLRAVVQQFALEIRTYERVVDARREGDRFLRTTLALDGQPIYEAVNVVLATGAMHAPRLLGIPGEDLSRREDHARGGAGSDGDAASEEVSSAKPIIL